MKICNRCKIEKSFAEFHRRKDAYQPYCKVCKKENDAEYRRQNMDYFIARAKQQRIELYIWYNELKSKPCTDCGGTFDPVAMQWDHLPEYEKVASVSELIVRGSKTKALEEIAKCELVCANCHAVRTKNRRGQLVT